MSTCPFCSEEIAADSAECPSCGMELPGPSPADVSDAPPVQPSKSNAKKWILIGGAGCGFCLLILACLAALLLPALGRARDAMQKQAAEAAARNEQLQASEGPLEEMTAVDSDGLTDEQVAAILKPHVGEFEGTAVVKKPDGTVQEEFRVTSTVRWLDEGKSVEVFSTEQHEQGKQEFIFTKSYDRGNQRFVLTRRKASDPKPESFKPGAHETYDSKTKTFHGVVVDGLPPDSTWTWTMQFIGNDRSIYIAEFRMNGTVQTTRTDTVQRVKGLKVPIPKD